MKKIILIAILGLILVSPQAMGQIFIEEGKKVHSIEPGQRITGTLIVNNTSERAINIKAYWEDFEYVAPFDGTKKFMPAGTTNHSFSSWAAFNPREFELTPYGKKKIDYVFDVPQGIKGGYYGVLFLENVTDSFVDKTGVNVVTRVGCLFFLEAADKNIKVTVENITIENGTVKGSFINEGDAVLIPAATYYVLDRSGVAQDRGEIKKLYLPPTAMGEFSFKLKEGLPEGTYTAVITFDLEGDVVVREVDFTKDALGNYKVLTVRE